jgi:hypothetical protein
LFLFLKRKRKEKKCISRRTFFKTLNSEYFRVDSRDKIFAGATGAKNADPWGGPNKKWRERWRLAQACRQE